MNIHRMYLHMFLHSLLIPKEAGTVCILDIDICDQDSDLSGSDHNFPPSCDSFSVVPSAYMRM